MSDNREATSFDHDLPILPNGWQWTLLGDVAEIVSGITKGQRHSDTTVLREVPYLRVANVQRGHLDLSEMKTIETTEDRISKLRLCEGDVLFNEGGDRDKLGRGWIWNGEIEDCIHQNHVFRARLLNGIYPKFVSFHANFFGQEWFWRHGTQSVNLASINQSALRKFPVPVAPTNEQRRIVERIDELFSELDAGVAALKRVQANLKRYRASVLKAAVEGKLTEEWRAVHQPKETGEQLLTRILEERRQKWEAEQLADYKAKGKEPPKNWQAKYKEPDAPDTSELPELPQGWCWASLDQIGILDRGRSRHRPRNAKHLYGGPYPFVQTGDVRHANTYLTEFTQTYSEAGLHQSKMWPRGTLCITIAANIAETAILGFDGCFPDSVVGMLPVSERVSIRYVEFYLRTIQERLESIAPATAQKNLNLETLREVPICLPSPEEQKAIVESVDEKLSVAEATECTLEAGLKRAARLRQSILKDAFEGKLVAQDPADEPASELLAGIKAERQQPNSKPTAARGSQRVPKKITERRGAIVAYTIAHSNGQAFRKSETLGRTKLVKALYIAQTHEELDLQFRFQRYAAGPFDEAIFKLEGTANKNDWFTTKERETYGVTYHPAANTDAMCEEATSFLGDQKASLDRLLGHMATMDTKQAELFATTYAAWNDLLIDGKEANDDSIITEFYSWDESKKKFNCPEIINQLKWMRSEGYVPTGKGQRTVVRGKATKLPSRRAKTRSKPNGREDH